MSVTDSSMRSLQAGTAPASAAEGSETRFTSSSQSPKKTSSATSSNKSSAPNTPPSSVSRASTPDELKQSAAHYQAECDWQCLVMVVSIFTLAYSGRWLLCMLLEAFSTTVVFSVQLPLLLLKQHMGITICTGLFLCTMFGCHEYITTPSWLQRPVSSADKQSTEESSNKQNPSIAKQQQRSAIDIAPVVTLAHSPIVAVDIPPSGPAITTTIQTYSPIAVIVDTVPANWAVAATFEPADNHSCLSERNDTVEHDESTTLEANHSVAIIDPTAGHCPKASITEHSVASSTFASQENAAHHNDEGTHGMSQPVVETTIVFDNHSVIVAPQHSDVDTALTGPMRAVKDETEAFRKAAYSFVDDTSESDEDVVVATTSGSTGSGFTLPSSDEGLRIPYGEEIVGAKSAVGKNESPKIAETDVNLIGLSLTEHEDVRDVLKGMSRLAALYGDFQSEDALQWMNRLFNGLDASAKEKFSSSMKELKGVMEQQMTTTKKPWTPSFYEGPLWHIRVDKRDAGFRGVIYVADGQPPSEIPGFEASECGWSEDRSLAGDDADIDWLHCFLENCLSKDFVQYLMSTARASLSATRYERTGVNVAIDFLETIWYQNYGNFASLNEVCAFQKARAQRYRLACPQAMRQNWSPDSGQRPYLTGEELAAINEGACDYNSGNVGEVCGRLLYLRKSPEHVKLEDTNPVPDWVAQIDQHELLDPYAFDPRACGCQAMGAVLAYREEQEPGYPTEKTCASLFELNYLSMDELDCEYDRKELENEAETRRIGTPPRCRDITQFCDLHAVSTNNIWILLDDSAEDTNDRIMPTDNSLPVPGMRTFTSYLPGFRITQGFLQVPYEDLYPRCKHGHLHPPAMEFCLECFPSGRHFDCTECENHPLLYKPEGRDFTIEESNEIERDKLDHDQGLMLTAYDAQQKNEWYGQWEVNTASRPMKYAW